MRKVSVSSKGQTSLKVCLLVYKFKLEINNRNKFGKSSNTCKLNNITLNNKSQGKLENILKGMKIKTQHIKLCETKLGVDEKT